MTSIDGCKQRNSGCIHSKVDEQIPTAQITSTTAASEHTANESHLPVVHVGGNNSVRGEPVSDFSPTLDLKQHLGTRLPFVSRQTI
jgi:hypothetical protein